MTVDAPGKALAYRQGITLAKGQVRICNVRLQPVKSLDYRLSSSTATDGKYGFWEMRLFGAGDRIVAIKGVHPPAQNSTAYVLALDLRGRELWRVATGEECWGLDVNAQGDRIAVACFDGIIRVLDASGATVATLRTTPGMDGTFARGPQTSLFSPDGRSLVVETEQGTTVLDTTTWQPRWTTPERPYQVVWSADGSRLVMGAGELVMSYTSNGELQWQRPLGNVALYLSMDSTGRTYAAGKSRELFVYEPDGSLAWSFRAAHTVNRTFPNAGIVRDGSLVLLPTFNGLDQALDRAGRIQWQRYLPLAPQVTPQGETVRAVYGPGHNSTYVAPDGGFVLQGTRGGQVVRYDSHGSLVWQSAVFPSRPGWIDDGHYSGANAIVATPDGRVIVAGFMDSTIRIFRLS
jgi:WD40 repeat protein